MRRVILYTFTLFLTTSCKEQTNPTSIMGSQKIVVLKDSTSTTANPQKNNPKKPDHQTPEVHHYICYTDDHYPFSIIWISFTANNRALEIKYKGQLNSIALRFEKEVLNTGDSYATSTQYYKEIFNKKINGTYQLTHSGNWDYVTYQRQKDGKIFHFTIDHNANPYTEQPCF